MTLTTLEVPSLGTLAAMPLPPNLTAWVVTPPSTPMPVLGQIECSSTAISSFARLPSLIILLPHGQVNLMIQFTCCFELMEITQELSIPAIPSSFSLKFSPTLDPLFHISISQAPTRFMIPTSCLSESTTLPWATIQSLLPKIPGLNSTLDRSDSIFLEELMEKYQEISNNTTFRRIFL